MKKKKILCTHMHKYIWASQVSLVVKDPPANAGNIRNMGSISQKFP